VPPNISQILRFAAYFEGAVLKDTLVLKHIINKTLSINLWKVSKRLLYAVEKRYKRI